jgi:hypothetical protein
MTRYECKTCGGMVALKDGVYHRSCQHKDAIIANMKATAYGESHVNKKAG